ncbi:MAG: transcription termination/antitermination factor NusG [Muribaculaceae bacterium]|nr:transcription termination/antitermination factor NusG [Muribaculaceae bacterium]
MNEEKKQWYVLRAISGKEQKVKELLDAACKNSHLGDYLFQVLIPTEKVYATRGGKKVLKEKNLFSGYVFVQAHLTGEVEDLLRNTTNVIDFVRSRDAARKPEPIREAEISRMLGAAQTDDVAAADDVANDFIVGETVKVTFGPFNGFTGEIEEVNREKRKLKVSVKVFGRKTPLELDNSQVERE